MKNLRKLAAGLTLLGLSTSVLAATTGTLLLQGQVAQELAIVVTAEAGASNLDLSANVSDLKVATVNEASNSNSGYKITIASANDGELQNGALDSLSYTLKYGGAAVTLSSTAQDAKVQATGGVYSVNTDVEISYTGQPAASMVEGTYSDTLTFTIVAN